jgi:hypothetical protein
VLVFGLLPPKTVNTVSFGSGLMSHVAACGRVARVAKVLNSWATQLSC